MLQPQTPMHARKEDADARELQNIQKKQQIKINRHGKMPMSKNTQKGTPPPGGGRGGVPFGTFPWRKNFFKERLLLGKASLSVPVLWKVPMFLFRTYDSITNVQEVQAHDEAHFAKNLSKFF